MPAIPTLNFADAIQFVINCLEVDVTPCLVGPPGIGKTALVRMVGPQLEIPGLKSAGLPVADFIASNCDSVDIAGLLFPNPKTGGVDRFPIEEIKRAIDAPHLLFCDELTAVPPSVRGPLLRLLLERVAGSLPLHKHSRIMAAMNDPEHAPNAMELDAANANRLLLVELAPSIDEVGKWFAASVGDEGSALREEARDWAATLNVESRLLEMSPPAVCVQEGRTWGSPRAWERGLRAYVRAGERGCSTHVQHATLEAAVGAGPATTYRAVKDLRVHLPSVDQIEADPLKAKLPDNPAHQIAAIGLLTRVAARDSYAAWAYCDRLRDEIAVAATRGLFTIPNTDAKKSKHASVGNKAKIKMLSKAKRALNGEL